MPEYIKEFSIQSTLCTIDGISGSGKLVLSELTKALSNTECWQHDYLFDTLPIIDNENDISSTAASALLRTKFDELTYNLIIGRNINFRIGDQSCILRSEKLNTYLQRLLSKPLDGEKLIEYAKKRLVPIMVHMSTFNNDILEASFKDRVKLSYVVRNPLFCVEHWWSYIERIGNDPREFTLSKRLGSTCIPWYIDRDHDLYVNGTPLDKSIVSIYCLYQQLYKKLLRSQNEYFIADFDDLVKSPLSCLNSFRDFVGAGVIDMRAFRAVCKRNKIPRDSGKLVQGFWKHYGLSRKYDSSLTSELDLLNYYKSRISIETFEKLDHSIEIYSQIKSRSIDLP